MNLPSCQPGELWLSLKPENGWSSPFWKLPSFPFLLYTNQRAKVSYTSTRRGLILDLYICKHFPRSRAITIYLYLSLALYTCTSVYLLLARTGQMQRRTNSIACVCFSFFNSSTSVYSCSLLNKFHVLWSQVSRDRWRVPDHLSI